MPAETGELLVGAYLRIVKECPIVQYNVYDPRSSSQGEIDVLGLDYATGRLYVCEVATHLDGLHYVKQVEGKSVDYSVEKITEKLRHAREFVQPMLPQFPEPAFMVWSPYVPVGKSTKGLEKLVSEWTGPGTLGLRINDRFATAVQELADLASTTTKQRGEPFFRTLQLLTHLRGPGNRRLGLRLE